MVQSSRHSSDFRIRAIITLGEAYDPAPQTTMEGAHEQPGRGGPGVLTVGPWQHPAQCAPVRRSKPTRAEGWGRPFGLRHGL